MRIIFLYMLILAVRVSPRFGKKLFLKCFTSLSRGKNIEYEDVKRENFTSKEITYYGKSIVVLLGYYKLANLKDGEYFLINDGISRQVKIKNIITK